MALENPIDIEFRDKVVMGVGDVPGQFPGCQVRRLKRDVHNQFPDRIRDTIPMLAYRPALILKALQTTLLIGPIPAVELLQLSHRMLWILVLALGLHTY